MDPPSPPIPPTRKPLPPLWWSRSRSPPAVGPQALAAKGVECGEVKLVYHPTAAVECSDADAEFNEAPTPLPFGPASSREGMG